MTIIIQDITLTTSMYVVNFDFSEHILPIKLLLINLPIVLTQTIAYPLQRIQTLMISSKKYVTNNQINQLRYYAKSMWGNEGFPKLLHGMRYSIDYNGTMMTTKFLMFDFLMNKTVKGEIQTANKWIIITNCFISNTFSTAMAQIAFHYQILASSLPIDKNNLPENVKIKLQQYTQKNKIPIAGLRNTVPVSIFNTILELIILNKVQNILSGFQYTNNSYVLQDLFAAFSVFTLTSFASHYALQRQIEICLNMKKGSIDYKKGLLATLIRQNLKGMLLFGIYFSYFEYSYKKQLSDLITPSKNVQMETAMPYRG